MPPLAWLIGALVAAVAAYAVTWPVWQESRERDARDTNTERYLRWRGRAPREPASRERWSPDERRRLIVGGVLAVVSVAALIGFFASS